MDEPTCSQRDAASVVFNLPGYDVSGGPRPGPYPATQPRADTLAAHSPGYPTLAALGSLQGSNDLEPVLGLPRTGP